MSQPMKIKGTVERVVRVNGKNEAQIVLTVNKAFAADIPLGAVAIEIQTLQSAMFDKENNEQPVRGAKGPKTGK